MLTSGEPRNSEVLASSPCPHLDTLLRGHLPFVHLVRLVPHEDLLDPVGSVLRGSVARIYEEGHLQISKGEWKNKTKEMGIKRERDFKCHGGRKHRGDSAQEMRPRSQISGKRAKIDSVYIQINPRRK